MHLDAATLLADSSTRYIANVYYNGSIEHHMSGNTPSTLVAKLHLMISTMHSGWSGDIIDQHDSKTIHRCSYQAPE